MNLEITPTLNKIIETHVFNSSICVNEREYIFNALKTLLNGDFKKYNFDSVFLDENIFDKYYNNDLNKLLSKINEKEHGQKENGRYYTPKDLTGYIVSNCFINIIDATIKSVYNTKSCLESLSKNKKSISQLLFRNTVFDPTCGAGEFLISALELKFELLKKYSSNPADEDYLNIIKTIYGNDINNTSIEITKIRLFFLISPYIKNISNLENIAVILNNNFYNKDFIANESVQTNNANFQKFNIIIGNPPFLEDNKSKTKPLVKYGNIYGNVMENSAKMLKKEGVMGFVLPLSYIATTRMKKIRDVVNYYCPKQILLNFADRPDCLFTGVHQKLTILLCSNQTEKTEIYTSGYKYWYKSERHNLLHNNQLIKTDYTNLNYIPKIENEIEKSIFEKIIANKSESTFFNLNKTNCESNLYLNMRACFWIKAFSNKQTSNEYKAFSYDDNLQPYIISLLNSSLFFFYWIAVSDCWHITNKELSSFKIILDNVDFKKFKKLSNQLENKLEETKEYIATKQTQYAYKHKFCKNEINLIDNELSKIYNLTELELEYIKNYKLKYRMSK